MPANDFDHRAFANDNTTDIGFAIATAMLGANPPLDLSAAQGSTYAYGAAAGTTPTAFTTQAQFQPGSNALRGRVFFNTGSSTPAGGLILTVTFPVAVPVSNLGVLPFIFVNPAGISVATAQASAAFPYAAYPTMSGSNCTGFTLYTSGTLTASQGTATAAAFGVEYWMIP